MIMTTRPNTNPLKPNNNKLNISPTNMAYITMFVAWILSMVFIRGFNTVTHNYEMLRSAAFLGIIVVGQAMVIVTGGIDLSVSSVVTLSTVVCSTMIMKGLDTWLAVLVALLVSASVGIFNAVGITFLRVPPIIMTIAMISLIEGIMLIFTNGTPPSGITEGLRSFANNTWFFGMSNIIFIWIVVAVFGHWLMSKSKLGRMIYAIGSNEQAAYLSGVNPIYTKFAVYSISSILAGLSGILQLGYMGSTYLTIGTPFQLSSIAAVVMGGIAITGGKGNFLGNIAGVLIITILKDALVVVNISSANRELFQGMLILIILLAYGREHLQK